jgi:hypothetical protein
MVKLNEPSFGLLAMRAVFAARAAAQSAGLPFMLGDGAKIIDELDLARKPASQGPKTPRAKALPLDDDAWLTSLEITPCYQGIDVRRELGKCQHYFGSKPRPVSVSRQRFVAWLNKSEQTIGYNGRGKSSAGLPMVSRAKWDPAVEPANWHLAVKKLHPAHWETLILKRWEEFPFEYRQEFAKCLGII